MRSSRNLTFCMSSVVVAVISWTTGHHAACIRSASVRQTQIPSSLASFLFSRSSLSFVSLFVIFSLYFLYLLLFLDSAISPPAREPSRAHSEVPGSVR